MEETEKNKEEREDDGINLLDYFIVLAKRKNLIISITLTVSVITAVYSLFLPKIYRAETRIISLGESKSNSFLMREFSDVIGMGRSMGGLNDPIAISSIIKSRTIYNRIIDRFDLMDIYEAEDMESARSNLDDDVIVESEKPPSIMTVAVLNRDPKLATDIANAFVEELITFLRDINFTVASRKKIFFEEKLKQTKEDLIRSEEAMREFQEKTGMLKVEEQARAVIESIANMRAQIALKEVELKVMKTYSTANNPDLQMIQEGLIGLKGELKKLEAKEGSDPETLMPVGRMPVVGTDYIRKLRNLKFNEGLFELISKQYEMARIDEAKESAIIQVIDKAFVPKKRFKPNRTKMVVVSAVISFFLGVFLAFFIEYIEICQSRGSNYRERMETLKRYISFQRGK